ncbi:hypothetical protein CONPUDRAFT_61496, partial [Coniophora puteana RWD-64-598 SS2]
MEEAKAEKWAEVVAKKAIEAVVERATNSLVASLSPHVARVQDAAISLADTNKRLETSTRTDITTGNPSTPKAGPRPSFRDVVTQALKDPQSEAQLNQAAKASIKRRQIMFDIPPEATAYPTTLSAKETASRLQLILDATKMDESPELKIRNVSRPQRTCILVEMLTEDAADWLRSPTGASSLASILGDDLHYRPQAFNVFVKFIPLPTEITAPDVLRSCEEANGLYRGALMAARWARAPIKRRPDQRFAHAVVYCRDPITANGLIMNGMVADHDKLSVRKDKKEPIRCAKCQLWGHVAALCLAPRDTCAQCGEDHRTANCNNHGAMHCASCKKSTHASWDRNCPVAEQKRKELDAKYPENSLPLYSTVGSW